MTVSKATKAFYPLLPVIRTKRGQIKIGRKLVDAKPTILARIEERTFGCGVFERQVIKFQVGTSFYIISLLNYETQGVASALNNPKR